MKTTRTKLKKIKKTMRRYVVQSACVRVLWGTLVLAMALRQSSVYADTFGGSGDPGGTFIGTGVPLWPVYKDPSTRLVTPGTTDPATPDLRPVNWGAIYNDNIGVTVGGTSATYGLTTVKDYATTRRVAGRISIGNIGGSSRSAIDDYRPLMGFDLFGNSYYNRTDTLGGLWPIPNDWTRADGYDFCSYVRANVDATAAGPKIVDVGFNGTRIGPNFRQLQNGGSFLFRRCDLATNVFLDETITLRGGLARFEWVIRNNDTIAHTVGLRYTANIRINAGPVSNPIGIFTEDATRGVSFRTQILDGAKVPAELNVYAARAEDPNAFNAWAEPREPFHVLQVFRPTANIKDATPPTRVWISDSDILRNDNKFYNPEELESTVPVFEDGIATATYYGGPNGYSVGPGQTRTVVMYYGNGSVTQTTDGALNTGLETDESLRYRTEGAVDAKGLKDPTLEQVAPLFMSPNPLKVYGTAYNNTVRTPGEGEVIMENASMTLSLPPGLRFAKVNGGTRDTATKAVTPQGIAAGSSGNLRGDQQGNAEWMIEPDGTHYGPLTLQMTVTTRGLLISKTVTRVINVPAPPIFPVEVAKYNMVGFPFTFDTVESGLGNPSIVLNTLSNTPDEATPSGPVILGYDAKTQSWVGTTFGDGSLRLETGKGYFYYPQISNTNPLTTTRLVFLKGVKPLSEQAPIGDSLPTPFAINLEKGWNLVSLPYVYETPLRYVQFVSLESNPNLTATGLTNAISTGLVRGGIYVYNPTTKYQLITDSSNTVNLKPYQAFWVRSNSRVRMIFPANSLRNAAVEDNTAFINGGLDPNPATRATALDEISSGRLSASAGTDQNWKLQIVARRKEGGVDSGTIIGVSPEATNPTRAMLPKPPVFKDDVAVALKQAGEDTNFLQVLYPSSREKRTWEMEVSSEKGGEIALQWPNIQSLSKRVKLTIAESGQSRGKSMRGTSSMTLRLKPGETKRLTIIAQPENTLPLQISNMRATSTRAVGVSGYNIAFNLTQGATVYAQVTTVTGKTVAVITTGRATTSGETRLFWNGRATDGSALPAGPYTFKVTAIGENDEPVERTAPIMTVR
jgi:hypothetical protein